MDDYKFNPADLEAFTQPLVEGSELVVDDTLDDLGSDKTRTPRITFSPANKVFMIHGYETDEHGPVTLNIKEFQAQIIHRDALRQIVVHNPAKPDDFSSTKTFLMPKEMFFNNDKNMYPSPLSNNRICDDFSELANTIGRGHVKHYDAYRFTLCAVIPEATYEVKVGNRLTTKTVKDLRYDNIILAYKIASSKKNKDTIKKFERDLNTTFGKARKLLNGINKSGRTMPTYGIIFDFYVGDEHSNQYIDKNGNIQEKSLNFMGISTTDGVEKGNFKPYLTEAYKANMEYLNEEVDYTGFIYTDNKGYRNIDEETRTVTRAVANRQEQMKFIHSTTIPLNYKNLYNDTLEGLGFDPDKGLKSLPKPTAKESEVVVEAEVVTNIDDLLMS